MLSQMLHELWVIVFVVLIGIGIFAGEGLLIGFSVMGLLVVGTSRLWNKASLENLTYEREFSQRRVFMGEKATLTITLTNRKPLPLGRVRVEDDMPACMTLEGADVVNSPNPEAHTLRHSTSMSWYERIRWTYEFQCDRRGYFRVGPSYLRSGDLLGFFGSERESQDRDYVLVYPRLVSLPEIGIPSARPLGETRGGIRIFEDMARPMGLRDYQTGDALKTVDWKASARMQELQVRTYEPSTFGHGRACRSCRYDGAHLGRLFSDTPRAHHHGCRVVGGVRIRATLQSWAVLERHAGARRQTDEDRPKPSAGAADDYPRSARVRPSPADGFDHWTAGAAMASPSRWARQWLSCCR